jgi:putative oxidoreductase
MATAFFAHARWPLLGRGLGWLRTLRDAADHWLAPVVLLAIRLWMAEIFFRSGMLKLQDIGSATYLFADVDPVPLLPPVVAAWFATAIELIASTLLAVGLCARLAALPMPAMTLVIQFIVGAHDPAFYVQEHFYWMFLLGIVIAVGPGTLSLDHWLERRFSPQG